MVTVRQVLVNSLWSLITFGTSFVFGIIFAVILPNILDVGQYGQYGYYFRVFSWIGSLGAMFVPAMIFRYLPELQSASGDNKLVLQRFLCVSLKYQLLISLVVSLGAAVYLWCERGDFQDFGSYIVAGIMVIVAGLMMSLQIFGRSYMEAQQQYRQYTRIGFYSSLAKIIGLAAILAVGLKTAVYCFGVVLFEQLVMVLMMVLLIVSQWQSGFGSLSGYSSVLSRMKDYGLSMGIGGLFSLVSWGYVEVFMIKALYRGNDVMEQLGYYCLAVSMATMLVRVLKNVTNPLTTFFVHHRVAGNKEVIERSLQKSMVFTIVIGCGGMLFLFLFSQELFSFLFPVSMTPARLPLLILLIPSGILCMTLPLGPLQLACEQHKFLMWTNIIAAGLNLLLDIILIPEYGAMGAAIVNCVIQTSICFLSALYLYKCQEIVFPIDMTCRIISCLVLIIALSSVLRHFDYSLAGMLLFWPMYIIMLGIFKVISFQVNKSIWHKITSRL